MSDDPGDVSGAEAAAIYRDALNAQLRPQWRVTHIEPVQKLAQAILDGRVSIRTEFYETRDGENVAHTEIRVANA